MNEDHRIHDMPPLGVMLADMEEATPPRRSHASVADTIPKGG